MSKRYRNERDRAARARPSPPPPPDPSLPSPGKVTLTVQLARQRRSQGGAREEDAQPTAADHAEHALALAAAGPSQRLPQPFRDEFERSLRADLGGVRVHTDARSGEAARAIGARAYTTGSDIHFAPGAYDPRSTEGRRLLAHEVAHTVQQADAPSAPQAYRVAGPADALEREADQAAEAMLAGRPAHLSAGVGARAIQRKIATVISRDDQDVITDVRIAGRPEHVNFTSTGGGREGDHTTAWSTMRIAVLNQLRGRSITDAVSQLRALFTQAQALPGAQTQRVNAMEPGRRELCGRAYNDTETHILAAEAAAAAQANAPHADRVQSALQVAIGTYLTYRNAIGLSVMDLGRNATTDGERKPLQLLQYWEENWTDTKAPDANTRSRLKRAMAALLAPAAKSSHDVGRAVSVPGRIRAGPNPDSDDDVRDAIADQHLESMRSAFPNVTAHLDRAQRAEMQVDTHGEAWFANHAAEANQATGSEYGVQIVLAADDRIEKATVSGRPPHALFPGSQEGDHTTAFLASRAAVESALRDKTLAEARQSLDQLHAVYTRLPGAQRAARLEGPTSKPGTFAYHHDAAETMLSSAHGEANRTTSLQTLQRYAAALLYFRNAIALVVVEHRGAGSAVHEEKTARDKLEKFEAELAAGQPGDSEQVVVAVAGLFDSTVFYVARDAVQKPAEQDESTSPALIAPGLYADERLNQFLADVLLQHLMTVKQFSPRVVDMIIKDIKLAEDFTYFAVPSEADVDYRGIANYLVTGVSSWNEAVTADTKNAWYRKLEYEPGSDQDNQAVTGRHQKQVRLRESETGAPSDAKRRRFEEAAYMSDDGEVYSSDDEIYSSDEDLA